MKIKLLTGLAILSMSFFGVAYAQAQGVQPGVARISLIHGDVSTQRGDSGDWVAGTLNAPVVAGDHVSTGTRSQMELQLDHANILRLDERSEAKIADLTRTHIQVQVSQGIVNYTVFKGSEADLEIDTPNAAIHPLRDGKFRIQVTSDEESEVIVRGGEADVSTPQGSTRVQKGQMITIRGRDNPEYQTTQAPRNDSWDDWNKTRDHQIQDAQSWGHVNRYYTGVDDLDTYGHWVYVPGYGEVWSPAVAVGWAPYRDGRWVWEPYYGWTWVSYEPWGWAPYHYGRWFLYSGSWCWWPGPVYAAYRPVWAPAYVSFFGFAGRHFAVGFGFGSIGWLPIGPSDFFYPWWGAYRRSVNVVNVTNITNITNITNVNGVRPVRPLAGGSRPAFSNLRGVLSDTHLQQGVTTMSSEQFGKAAVPRNFQRVTATELHQGHMVAGTVPVVPTRESLRPVDHAVNPATLPARANQPERFFTKSRPTFTPEPFHAQAARVQEALQQHQMATAGDKAGATSPVNTAKPTAKTWSNPPKPMTQAATVAPSTSSQGWHRFGGDKATPTQQSPMPQRPQSQPPARNNSQTAPNTSGGWRKFSGPDGQRNPGNTSSPQPPERETDRRGAPARTETPSRDRLPSQAAPQGRPDWQHFSPQPEGRSSQHEPSRGYSRPSQPEPPRSYDRPALNLQRPIVAPRAPSGHDGNYRGGRGSASGGGGPSGGGGNHSSSRSSEHSSGHGDRR